MGLNTLNNARENKEISLQLSDQSYKQGRIYRCWEFDYIFQSRPIMSLCGYLYEFPLTLSGLVL